MSNVDYNCIFCTIAAKRAPAAIIYENDGALAFLDIHPVVEGHVLIVPKKHCRNIFDFDDASGNGLMKAQRIVARALRKAYNADGLTIWQSNERAGGQDVFHYHAHLIPRFAHDGLMTRDGNNRSLTLRAPSSPSRETLEAVAQKIRAHISEA